VPMAMNLMLPYIENLLFETAVPIILVTTHDLYLFKDEGIEFIRKQSDHSAETLFSNRINMIELV
jgi:hypothetical protein